MDIVLVVFGFILMLIGILGSFLPVLPGPPLSWLGLLLLYLTKAIPNDWTFLIITLVVAIAAVVLDYIIPAMGAKRFGGSKKGMIGTTLGLLVAMIFPVFGFLGIIIWPFIGAIVGELLNKSETNAAVKAGFGSFLGFLAGTLLKFSIGIVYLWLFIDKFWDYKSTIF